MKKQEELMYGAHAIRALIEHHPERVKTLFHQEGRQDQAIAAMLQGAKKKGLKTQTLPRQRLEQMTGSPQHQGIAASCAPTPLFTEQDIPNLLAQQDNPLVLVLDSIQDPQNLGACLRTADACGTAFVLISKNQSVGLTAVVHKAACGASQTVPIVKATNMARALKILQEHGLWLVGTALGAKESIYEMQLQLPTAIVLGNEGKGLRQGVANCCDHLVEIPMVGHVASLNISVANAVCLYECMRQRRL